MNPSYGNCAMADPKVFGNTIQNTCSDWKSVDGGQWFLRDKPMSVVGHNDPDKDYCVGGFLNFWGFWSYKNGRCLDPKVSPSICSANRRELARVNRCSPKCQGTCYTETGRFADAWRKDCKSLSSPDDWFTTNPSGIQMFTKNYKCIANCDGLRLYDTWAGVNGDPNKCKWRMCAGDVFLRVAETI